MQNTGIKHANYGLLQLNIYSTEKEGLNTIAKQGVENITQTNKQGNVI